MVCTQVPGVWHPRGRRHSKMITTESVVRQEHWKTRAHLSVLLSLKPEPMCLLLLPSEWTGLRILFLLKVRDVMHASLVCGQG